MAERQDGFKTSDQKILWAKRREDSLQLPSWHQGEEKGGQMEGADSFRYQGSLGPRGSQGYQAGSGGGFAGTPSYGAGGFGSGRFQGGAMGGQMGLGAGISGAGVGHGGGGGGGGVGVAGGGGGALHQGAKGFQAGGFRGPASRIFTSPGR